jgi:hypothetical protein
MAMALVPDEHKAKATAVCCTMLNAYNAQQPAMTVLFIPTSETMPYGIGAAIFTPATQTAVPLSVASAPDKTINVAEIAAIHKAVQMGSDVIATDSLCSTLLGSPAGSHGHPFLALKMHA